MSLTVAILTAAVLSILGFKTTSWQYWLTWARGSTLLGTAVYLVVAGGAGGLIGWWVAQLANADPPGGLLANGFFYGVAGALALRADFSLGKPAPGGTQDISVVDNSSNPQVKGALAALGAAMGWAHDFFNMRASRAVENWYRRLDQPSVLEMASRISTKIQELPIDDAAKVVQLKSFAPAAAKMRGADATAAAEASHTMIQFCVNYTCLEQLAKPADGALRFKSETADHPSGVIAQPSRGV